MAQISPATSMTYFCAVTIGAFILKYFMAKSYASRNSIFRYSNKCCLFSNNICNTTLC